MNYNSIPEMIRDRAAKYQNREVLKYRERNTNNILSISWNKLVDDFTTISRVLLADGYQHGDNIGLFSSNCPEWTITDLAILNIRAVVVPFFSTASKEQCKYIVDETAMKLMFVGDKEQLDKAEWLLENTTSLQSIIVFNTTLTLKDERCILLSDYVKKQKASLPDVEKIQEEAKPADLATIIYTSGTTGEPKGVMLINDNFLYTFTLHEKRLDLNENDLSMAFLPLSHIFERTWTFYLLYCGGTNFYLDNPKQVIEVLPIAKPTIMCTVPRFYEKTYEGILTELEKWPSYKKSIFNWSIGVGYEASDKRKNSESLPFGLKIKYAIADKLVLKKLRQIFGGNMRAMPCSGAALPLHLLKFFHATGVFVNYGYGATETTATVSCFKTDKYEFESVGTIMPGLQVKIGDQDEILVKGRTVFVGYYKKPGATSEALVDGWYKTGDEGRITANGNLVMTDRIRDLMKTSVGKYVSPQKLETLLGQDPIIEQIVVIGDNRKYVTALIVPLMEKLKEAATELGIMYDNDQELLTNKEIHNYLLKRINKLQQVLSENEQVRKFTLLDEAFSIENDALTSTLKTKRRVIEKRYASKIERMYLHETVN